MSEPLDREKLAAEAKERVDGMPAETALGNEDAAGGHAETVEEYRNVQNDQKKD
ncbi:hypothetical protein ACXR2U_11765 [Jatrophihabitans sp. YIM 134969]